MVRRKFTNLIRLFGIVFGPSFAANGNLKDAFGSQVAESEIIVKIGKAIVAIVEPNYPDWAGISFVLSRDEESIGFSGHVYYSNKEAETFSERIPNETLFLGNILYAETKEIRGKWKRLLFKIRNGDSDYRISYDYNEINPWGFDNLENYGDVQELIESMRP